MKTCKNLLALFACIGLAMNTASAREAIENGTLEANGTHATGHILKTVQAPPIVNVQDVFHHLKQQLASMPAPIATKVEAAVSAIVTNLSDDDAEQGIQFALLCKNLSRALDHNNLAGIARVFSNFKSFLFYSAVNNKLVALLASTDAAITDFEQMILSTRTTEGQKVQKEKNVTRTSSTTFAAVGIAAVAGFFAGLAAEQGGQNNSTTFQRGLGLELITVAQSTSPNMNQRALAATREYIKGYGCRSAVDTYSYTKGTGLGKLPRNIRNKVILCILSHVRDWKTMNALSERLKSSNATPTGWTAKVTKQKSIIISERQRRIVAMEELFRIIKKKKVPLLQGIRQCIKFLNKYLPQENHVLRHELIHPSIFDDTKNVMIQQAAFELAIEEPLSKTDAIHIVIRLLRLQYRTNLPSLINRLNTTSLSTIEKGLKFKISTVLAPFQTSEQNGILKAAIANLANFTFADLGDDDGSDSDSDGSDSDDVSSESGSDDDD